MLSAVPQVINSTSCASRNKKVGMVMGQWLLATHDSVVPPQQIRSAMLSPARTCFFLAQHMHEAHISMGYSCLTRRDNVSARFSWRHSSHLPPKCAAHKQVLVRHLVVPVRRDDHLRSMAAAAELMQGACLFAACSVQCMASLAWRQGDESIKRWHASFICSHISEYSSGPVCNGTFCIHKHGASCRHRNRLQRLLHRKHLTQTVICEWSDGIHWSKVV